MSQADIATTNGQLCFACERNKEKPFLSLWSLYNEHNKDETNEILWHLNNNQ